jgi:hypothetical protein
MCCLIKANLKQVTVGYYLNIRDSAVSNKRATFAKKLFGENATKSELDNFIFSKRISVLE